MLSVYFIALVGVLVATGAQLPAPYDLRIDHYKVATSNDLVIATARPRFSWKLPTNSERNVEQTAYQLQVQADNDRWDSGRVSSSQSIHVPYSNERALQPLTPYQVRLRLWTSATGEASAWTAWMPFRTSVFDLHDYLTQKNADVNWIGSTQIYMNELRKEFSVPNTSPIKSATVFISGIGYYELYLNGQSVDMSRKLDPGWTTYEKRTLFVSYDLTSKVQAGPNAVGVKLGNGWYSQEQYVPPSAQEPSYGKKTQRASRCISHLICIAHRSTPTDVHVEHRLSER